MLSFIHVRCAPRFAKFGVRLVGTTTTSCNSVETKTRRTLKRGPSLKDFLLPTPEGQTFKGMKITPPELHPYLTHETLRGDGFSVYVEVMGCQMNNSDAELVLAVLEGCGYTRTTNHLEADIWLVLTCSIREGAETKVIKKLSHIARGRKFGTLRKSLKIGVLGCMAERLKDSLLSTKEDIVDIVAGPDAYRDLPRLLAITQYSDQKAINVMLSLEETYADVRPVRLNSDSITSFVSIQRGCDNMCSYCIVPFTRGRERSRPVQTILDEIRILSDQGVKEVTLLGQNVNSYNDLSAVSRVTNSSPKLVETSTGFKTIYKPKQKGVRFSELLQKVAEINREMRIRFTSPHPKDFPDDVLSVIKENPNICKQIHLPPQAGSTRILDAMRRGYTREAYLNLVSHAKQIVPGLQFSGDIIVGFCGETEEEFLETMSLVESVNFNNLYIFPYSLREKTHAHRHLEDNVPGDVKADRMNRLISLYRDNVQKVNEALIGTQQIVLIEGDSRRSCESYQGRCDVNTKVIFPKRDDLKVGDYCIVAIESATSQSLIGSAIEKTSIQSYHECRQ